MQDPAASARLIFDLTRFDDDDPNALIGVMEILGAEFHVTAIRVWEDAQGTQRVYGTAETADEDDDHEVTTAEQLWDQFLEFEEPDAPMQTVELAGLEGRWVIWLVPRLA